LEELLELANTVDEYARVWRLPTHVGPGAPHWKSEVCGLISGLPFSSGPAQLARAVVEGMALQIHDIYAIMSGPAKGGVRLFVDGGPSQNLSLMGLAVAL
jgi:glycerol kinase